MGQPDLFIPHKAMSTLKQPDYKDDMRAIEIWAKGLKSGAGAGAVSFSAETDAGASGAGIPIGGMANASLRAGVMTSLLPLFSGDTGYPPGTFFSGTVITAIIGGGGWYSAPAAAASYNLLETIEVFAPNFTGPTPTIGILVYLRVAQVLTAAGAVNGFKVVSNQINIASGAHHQFVTGDFPAPTIQGADLTWTNTPLATLKSTGGLPYIGGWAVSVVWDTANQLTQA